MSILKYLFPLLLILSSSLSAKDTTELHLFQPALRLGFDAAGIIPRIWQPETMQLEFTGDFEYRPNVFISAEGGYLDINISKEDFDYNSDGIFFRLGADYNLLQKKEPERSDVIILSFRYGYSVLTHQAERVVITDPYWGTFNTSIDSETLNSHWVEAGFALKTELFNNIFLGWALRGRYLLYQSEDPLLAPYNIPGFGKIKNNKTAVSIHYGIFYRIPF
ncbi:MAG: DUF6048 family protein [Bacteroidales bacterium]